MSKKIAIAYIPVIHQGYRKFFESNPEYNTLLILGEDITQMHRSLQKDIRALKATHAKQALIVWNLFNNIDVINLEHLKTLNSPEYDLLMPDEDICRDLAAQYLPLATITFYPIFLRWDRRNSNQKNNVVPDVTISENERDKSFMWEASHESLKSSDIWRRVGAVIARNGHVLSRSYNEATPHSHSSWMNGDPRNNFNKGIGVEMSTFIHAEARLIATAAKNGESLSGTDMYVTTFPCPPCAMLIAYSGIQSLFFTDGYALLDGKEVLTSQNVKIVKVLTELKQDNPAVYVPYSES